MAPFKYNYTTNLWEIQGTFADYDKCNSHEYQNGNIDKFDPKCIS